jgi:hypothetical protein
VTIRPCSWQEMVAALRACGWDGPHFGKGKNPHPFFVKGKRRVSAYADHGEAISAPGLRRVLRKMEITDEQWEEARRE